ncbi:hypothetical protein K443DRAFT_11513 [Laccaria amethystina LaAM-08-1]|uniref:Uncharacterized protein n=1 Tax=Laccaria amethystina LaAM-08-1 TaxID=1095629 RepID=A0A0C9WTI2_9AGAR|nr:hypothetical protein K443DRAFT_11513 [Laccaria amethystina LaAM-08-1]
MATHPPTTSSIHSDDDLIDPSTGAQPNETSDVKEPSVKHPHVSNRANALMSMAESLSTFNTTLAGAFAPPSTGVAPTPVHCTNAIFTILKLEKGWLMTNECAVLIDFLKSDHSAADVYLVLTEPDVHTEWVLIQLNNLGVTVVPF